MWRMLTGLIDLINAFLNVVHNATHHHTELDKPGVVSIRMCYWRWPLRRIEWAWTSMSVVGAEGIYVLRGVTEADFLTLFASQTPREVHEWLAVRKYGWRA
jgi:hypothetical protein